MSIKKILAVLLSALMLFVVFTGCDGDEKAPVTDNDITENEIVEDVPEKEEETEPEAEEIAYEAHLSNERYDGYNYRILLRKGMRGEMYFEEPQDDLVDDAIYKRVKLIEDKFGITVSATETNATYETDALNAILAGDDAYDIIFAHSRAAFVYAVQGAVYNVNEISTINTDMPWWSKDIKNSCDINGHLYVLDGDITKQGLGSAMVMFFNKDIFDELGYDYPYEKVKDGEWTFDEFSYYARKGGKDLNGDGVFTPEEDRFGFYTGEWMAPISVLYSGGQKIYDKNDEGKLELTLYSNKTVDLFDDFFSLLDNEACYLDHDKTGYVGKGMFKDGRAMFTVSTLDSAIGMRNMENNFGILPYPKYDENDDYGTIINGIAHLAVIPITVPDVERTGAITEAFAAYGLRDITPVFYDKTLKTKHTRDDESGEMIDIVKDSIVYDIGYVAGGSFQSVGRDLAIADSHDFASFYTARETKATTALEEFNRNYGNFEE